LISGNGETMYRAAALSSLSAPLSSARRPGATRLLVITKWRIMLR
jgi:hypothetical protein